MCRNIRQLHNFAPPATPDEIHAAALQYVRKVSGYQKVPKVNTDVFEEAVEEIAAVTAGLLSKLESTAPPKDRDEEKRKARERWAKRAERIRAAN